MSIGTVHTGDLGFGPPSAAPGPPSRALVIYESGRSGAAALREGAELAAAGAELTVVTLAPQARPLKCCGGGGAGPYNCAVRDVAQEELSEARAQLGSLAGRTSFTRLTGTPQPPLAEWASKRSFGVIFVPGHTLGQAAKRRARELRRATDAEVRIVK